MANLEIGEEVTLCVRRISNGYLVSGRKWTPGVGTKEGDQVYEPEMYYVLTGLDRSFNATCDLGVEEVPEDHPSTA